MPVAVVIDRDPWLDAVGSDMPRIAIYDNGTAIWLTRRIDSGVEYRTCSLVSHQLDSIKDIIHHLIVAASMYNQKYFSLSSFTDQPTAEIYVNDSGKTFVVGVYGLHIAIGASTIDSMFTREINDSLPRSVLDLYFSLAQFGSGESQVWHPTLLEAMIWPYSYAPDESIIWPNDFPDLTSATSIQRHDSCFSIYMSGAKEDSLRSFLRSRRERGAIKINGRKMVAEYRYVFPSEPIWNRALSTIR